ncbi:MAG: ATP-dependent RecD-like DNA helicase [Candidatus Izimaplasma sp.]|nr:ATP-dependent RecD-like DNA helicase [Candidatus Izimaplasma bacterium]
MAFVEGTIKRYLFYSEENSYSVIKVSIIDTDETELIHYEPTIIVCGFFPKLEVNANYRFKGEITHHEKYGMQFNAISFERIIDNTYDGLVDYLSSDIFSGIGVKTAQRIIDALGIDALDLIADDKNVLDKVPRINTKLKDVLYQGIIENREMENTLVWLYGFSISPNMAMKIYSNYGIETKQIIKENPYILMEEIDGIGFKRADEIGLKVGFKYDSDLRIQAVIYYLLSEYMNKFGDTYLEREKLLNYTLNYLNNGMESEVEYNKVETLLNSLIEKGKVIQTEELISLNLLYYAEKFIAKKSLGLNYKTDELIDVKNFILDFQKMNDINYTKAQKKAISLALNNHFSIITGGPGTGKTTVIKGIVDIYKMLRNYQIDSELIKLAAPTGKAAKRLSEATLLPATTIHKLLGFDFEGQFKFGPDNFIDASIIIIDEASMIDCILMKRMLSAIKRDTILVLVGDANQLPSVGPGDVLNDLILSDLFPVQRLDIIHRQAKDSHIISLAYDVLEKQISEDIFTDYNDRIFMKTKDEYISSKILKVIDQAIKDGYQLLEDIQVLIPMYKGYNGINRLNDLIQETFNSDNKQYKIEYRGKNFYYQDKVMQLVNQPEKNVMNGDQGIIVGINDGKELIVDFSGNFVKYNIKELDNLTLAYVVSIHKSQGSEFKLVVLPFSNSYTIMLRKKLLYTAITRAKEKLIMVGNFDAYRHGILGKDRKRLTNLLRFLEIESQDSLTNKITIEDFLDEPQ